ncbi:MAG: tetratricopeptide repeat protein [Acidobacteriota bacterium]|nr:tetratricopeptide repeat protein [Acidobacteriota bacterium]
MRPKLAEFCAGHRQPMSAQHPTTDPIPEAGHPGAPSQDQAASSRGSPHLSTGKKILFSLVVCLLFFGGLELLLMVFGVEPTLASRDPYVGFQSYIPLFETSDDGRHQVTAANKLALFNRQSFPLEKKTGTVRIFTVGGSTTYGRPFDDATSFTGWLRTYLETSAPDQSWEVINAGGISYASYRVAKLMEELIHYQPDLFIIYSGNNEFLERRTYSNLFHEPRVITGAKRLAQRSRLWTLGERLMERRQRAAEERYRLTGEVQELLDTSAGLGAYHRDDEFAAQVLDHYRYNLQRMVNLAESVGARVILITIPVNEKDFAPFKAAHGDALDAGSRKRCEGLKQRVRRILSASSDSQAASSDRPRQTALELAEAAVELDPRDADAQYLLGRVLTRRSHHDRAGEAFQHAIVEDVCPLRALPEIDRAIVDTADANGLPLVDYRHLLKEEMRRRAGHGNLGDELFLDHVHPTVRANGLLGRALLNELASLGLAPRPVAAGSPEDLQVRQAVLARVDEEAYARAYKNLSKVLLWAGKYEEARKYVELADTGNQHPDQEDWELRYNAGVLQLEAGNPEAARQSLEQARRLAPGESRVHDQLGQAYAALGELPAALGAGRKAVELDPASAPAWSNLAALLSASGDATAAAEAARTALGLEPDLAEAHNNLGNALFDLGRFAAARNSYQRALELRPEHLDARLNLGLVLGQLGSLSDASEVFEAVLAARPGDPQALVGRGKTHLGAGRLAPALADFRAATAADPGSLEAWELLARSLITAGRLEESNQVLRQAMGALPDDPRLPHLLGRNLADAGRFPEARRAFQQAVDLDADYVEGWIDLGNLSTVLEQLPEAAASYRRALQLNPSNSHLLHSLAGVEIMDGDLQTGLRHLEQAVELAPDNAAALQDLAAVYEHLGRRQEALQAYGQALEAEPESLATQRSIERAIERLEQSSGGVQG